MVKLREILIFLTSLSMCLAVSASQFTPDPHMLRSEVPQEFKWDTSHIFADSKAWEKEIKAVLEDIPRLKSGDKEKGISPCERNLQVSATEFYRCYHGYWELRRRVYRVYRYSLLNYYADKKADKGIKDYERMKNLWRDFERAFSFLEPEIKEKEDKIRQFLGDFRIEMYKYRLEELWRQKRHVLSSPEELVKDIFGKVLKGHRYIYDALGAEMTWEQFFLWKPSAEKGKLEVAEIKPINPFKWERLKLDPLRRNREEASKAFLKSLKDFEGTYGEILLQSLEADWALAKTSNYESVREMKLDGQNVPEEVCDNLIDTVEESLETTLHEYVRVKRSMLDSIRQRQGLSSQVTFFRYYDRFAPLTETKHQSVSYDEARRIIVNALKPLGKDYISKLKKALGLGNGWIDVYPNEFKYDGSFTAGVYRDYNNPGGLAHPYICLNYAGTFRDMVGLANEVSHALHLEYANEAQPFANYSEVQPLKLNVVSTTNELMIFKYLIERAEEDGDLEEVIYLYDSLIQLIIDKLFRQTKFAHFEKIIHERKQLGKSLTPENLNQIYLDLVKKYYGDHRDYEDGQYATMDYWESGKHKDGLEGIEWVFIPHLTKKSFYVYSYAVAMAAAIHLSNGLEEYAENGDHKKEEQYLSFLRKGFSDSPINVLNYETGTDMASSKPIESSMRYFESLIDKLENLWASYLEEQG